MSAFTESLELSTLAVRTLERINPTMGETEFLQLTRKQVMSLRMVGTKTWVEIADAQEEILAQRVRKLNKLPYSAHPQDGPPRHCNLAQVFGPDGLSVATFDATKDPADASRNAQSLANALNKAAGPPGHHARTKEAVAAVNDLLTEAPMYRIIVGADGYLTLASTDPADAVDLQVLRWAQAAAVKAVLQ